MHEEVSYNMMTKTAPFPMTFLQDLPGLWGPRIQHVACTPFSVDELQKRVLQVTKKKDKGKPAFYIDPRTLDQRLSTMFGGAWSVGFHMDSTEELLIVRCTLNINGIVREDISSEPLNVIKRGYGADLATDTIVPNELAATKAQASAYKRAAVKFGISAYLYDFKDEIIWLPLNPNFKGQFAEPDIKLKDLPSFAKPIAGASLVLDELIYLCGTEDQEDVKAMLKKYWGLETLQDLNREDSIRLATCIARVSDFLEITGKTIKQLADERADAAKGKRSNGSVGFHTD